MAAALRPSHAGLQYDQAEFPPLPPPAIAMQPPLPDAAAACYDRDIHAYLRSVEAAAGPDYMAAASMRTKREEPVTPPMRAILVEWLSSLAPTFGLHSRTLHLAVSCLDRFLAAGARQAVGSVRHLIPIAAAALLLAAKYEEICPPEVDKLASEARRALDSDGGCTRDDLLGTERAVLKALEHKLGTPTAHTFLEHFLARPGVRRRHGHAGANDDSTFLASYIAELSLLDYGVLRFRPSVVAASAMLVARLTVRPCTDPWGRALEAATGYTAAELEECADALHRLHRNSSLCASESGFVHMKKKYSQAEFNRVSTLLPLTCIQPKYLM